MGSGTKTRSSSKFYQELFNKTTGGTVMGTMNNTSSSWCIPDIGIICRYLILIRSTICMAYLIYTVNIKETRMLMLVLIYDYLLLIYLLFCKESCKNKKRTKVAYIVDAQSQMGNPVLFDENPMQTFVVDVLKVMFSKI